MCKRCENEGDGKSWLANEKPDDLLYLLERFQSIAEAILSKNSVGSYRTKLLELFFVTVGFLRVADLYDDRYVTYAEKNRAKPSNAIILLGPLCANSQFSHAREIGHFLFSHDGPNRIFSRFTGWR